MDHIQFKANQSAAAYVARELDEQSQEAFEIHMMGCSECVNDVEAWRVIKLHMPAPEAMQSAAPFKKHWWGGWGMAASFLGAMLVAGAGGWFASASQHPSIDTSETAIFNLPAITRGAEECTQLPLAANTRAVVLRVPGVPMGFTLVAVDASGKELPASRYSAHEQRDGSWVARFDSQGLQRASAQLVSRNPDGADEALGCVTAAVAPPRD